MKSGDLSSINTNSEEHVVILKEIILPHLIKNQVSSVYFWLFVTVSFNSRAMPDSTDIFSFMNRVSIKLSC
jgi:hypothetical protein